MIRLKELILIGMFVFIPSIKLIEVFVRGKLFKVQPRQIAAEMIIKNVRRKQIRSAKVECAYNTTRYNFNKALKEHNINREQVLSIKKYLLRHTDKIDQDKHFKNDIHCIYSLMKSHKLKVRDFQIINCIIGGN
mgnify:FL=1